MRYFFICIVFIFSACDYITRKSDAEEKTIEKIPIARVNEVFLYQEDLNPLLAEATSVEDSISITNRFINSWVRKQLILDKAEEVIDINRAEIERKVQDYRYALTTFEFKKKYVSENLDVNVEESEIQEYYQNNLDNFLLNQNIVRCRYIQVPKDAPRFSKIRRTISSSKPKDIRELNSYCFQFASNYNLEDSIWLNFDDIVLNTPLKSIPNKIQFLKNNKMVETQDSLFKYLLYIKEYKIQDQLSPIEFVRDQIQNIIINKRKVTLSKELENKIYEEGVEQNSFEIFTD
ncbi:MAG: peptidyl-prolyl cis-trans isomerase [Cytophagales bacterium]